jgi:hypothetical protein
VLSQVKANSPPSWIKTVHQHTVLLANAAHLRRLLVFGERALGVYSDIVDTLIDRLQKTCRVDFLVEPQRDPDGRTAYKMSSTTAAELSHMSAAFKSVEPERNTHIGAILELHRLTETEPPVHVFEKALNDVSAAYRAYYESARPVASSNEGLAAQGYFKELGRQAHSREGKSFMQRLLGAKGPRLGQLVDPRFSAPVVPTSSAPTRSAPAPPKVSYPVYRLPEPLPAPAVPRPSAAGIPSTTPVGAPVVTLGGVRTLLPPPTLAFHRPVKRKTVPAASNAPLPPFKRSASLPPRPPARLPFRLAPARPPPHLAAHRARRPRLPTMSGASGRTNTNASIITTSRSTSALRAMFRRATRRCTSAPPRPTTAKRASRAAASVRRQRSLRRSTSCVARTINPSLLSSPSSV